MIYTDVSYYQNQPTAGKYLPIDWVKMARRAKGVIIRVAYGTLLDRQFVRNWAESKGIIKRGAYLYLLANKPIEQQAELMLKYATDPDLALMIDCEWRESTDGIAAKPVVGKYVEQVYQFATILEAEGYTPWIYSNWSTILTYLPKPLSSNDDYEKWFHLGGLPLCIAQYNTDKRKTLAGPNIPEPWIEEISWQVTDKGPGFAYGVHSNSIDLNRVRE